MDEAPEVSKANISLLLVVYLVVDTLKPSTKGSVIKFDGTSEGAEELFLSIFIDFLSLPVCVASSDI